MTWGGDGGTFLSTPQRGTAMKTIVLTAAQAMIGAAVLAVAASPAAAQTFDSRSVEIRDAVARVVVIVEDRRDVSVEVEPGAAGLPGLQIRRIGDRVVIDGGLRNQIRNCHSGAAYARQPGDGAWVEVRNRGRIDLRDASLIVIRSPRAVDVSAGSAVFGSVGPGAASIELGAGGCGDWTVANTTGSMELNVGGSGAIRAGTSRRLEAKVGGSGDIVAGATGDLDAKVGGSGSITVARADGPADLAIGGSGDITVRAGRIRNLSAAIAGSGDIDFRGEAGQVDAAIVGSGDIRVARASGEISRAVMGSGSVIVGR